MARRTSPATAPRPRVVISARRDSLASAGREVWDARELLLILAVRDFKLRYRQTILGAAWVVAQPLISALLFGFLHVLVSLFHQLFNAAILGVVLGLLAVRSRSLLPGILFHFLNNALAMLMGRFIDDPALARVVPWVFRRPAEGFYHWHWIIASGLASAALLAALCRSGEPDSPRVEGNGTRMNTD